jgi:hypothetical protein
MDSSPNLCGKQTMKPLSFSIFATAYAAVVIGALALLWLPRDLEIDWPAWVQAVGSVAAILAAVCISQWEASRARKDRIEDRRELRRAVAGLARRLADWIASQSQSLIDNPAYHAFEGSDYSEFALLDAALDRFDPSALVSAEGVLALEELRRTAKSADWWESVVAKDYTGAEYFDFSIDEALQRWCERADRCAVVLENLAAERSYHCAPAFRMNATAAGSSPETA